MTSPIRADEVQPEQVEWLWQDRIPKSLFTIIAGKPDQGKSMVATHIAAELTKQGKNVLYSSKERSFGLTEKPRFLAAGGVEERMHYWRFSLPRQMQELEEQIIEKEIDLVVMDPVSAHFIGVSLATDKGREVINPLVELAEATGCAFLFIEHALKRIPANAHPLDGIRGNSSGLPASCAMGFIFGTDPNNVEHKILVNVKHNICEQRKAMQFEVDVREVDGYEEEHPFLMFDEEIIFDAMRLLNKSAEDGGRGPGRPSEKRAAASEWLTNYLAKQDKPVLASQVTEDAKHFNMTARTLRRAAADMNVVKEGAGKSTTWALPEEILALIAESNDQTGATVQLAEPEVVDAEVVEDDDLNLDDDELATFLAGLNGGAA